MYVIYNQKYHMNTYFTLNIFFCMLLPHLFPLAIPASCDIASHFLLNLKTVLSKMYYLTVSKLAITIKIGQILYCKTN